MKSIISRSRSLLVLLLQNYCDWNRSAAAINDYYKSEIYCALCPQNIDLLASEW